MPVIKKFSIQAFSFVETLVAMSILSFLSLYIIRISYHQAKSLKQSDERLSSNYQELVVSNILRTTSLCNNNFAGKNVSSLPLQISTLREKSGHDILATSSNSLNKYLITQKIEIKSILKMADNISQVTLSIKSKGKISNHIHENLFSFYIRQNGNNIERCISEFDTTNAQINICNSLGASYNNTLKKCDFSFYSNNSNNNSNFLLGSNSIIESINKSACSAEKIIIHRDGGVTKSCPSKFSRWHLYKSKHFHDECSRSNGILIDAQIGINGNHGGLCKFTSTTNQSAKCPISTNAQVSSWNSQNWSPYLNWTTTQNRTCIATITGSSTATDSTKIAYDCNLGATQQSNTTINSMFHSSFKNAPQEFRTFYNCKWVNEKKWDGVTYTNGSCNQWAKNTSPSTTKKIKGLAWSAPIVKVLVNLNVLSCNVNASCSGGTPNPPVCTGYSQIPVKFWYSTLTEDISQGEKICKAKVLEVGCI